MKLRPFPLLLLTTVGLPAYGQEATANLRDALTQLPEIIVTNPSHFWADFVDVAGVLEITGAPLSVDGIHRMSAGGGLHPVQAIYNGGPEAFDEKAGIALEDIAYFTGFGQPPYIVSVWGLGEPAAVDSLIETLGESGFEPVENGIYANGIPLQMDMTARDPGSPWLGMTGSTSVVGAKDGALVQSSTPEAVAMLQSVTPQTSAAENPIVATALAGVDAALEDGVVAQAVLISPLIGLSADPMMELFTDPRDLDTLHAELEAAMADTKGGIPPYFGGFIVDAQIDGAPALVISLTYPGCDLAEVAVEGILTRWSDTLGAEVETSGEGSTVTAQDGCAAVVIFTGGPEETAANRVFAAAYDAIMRRQFSVLQIGQE